MTISGKAFETYVNATAHLVPYGARSPTIAPVQKTSRKISENPLPCPFFGVKTSGPSAVCST